MLVPFDEKLKDIALKIKDIAYKLGLIADYVVEHGTDGIWTYRKWASGIAECWGEQVENNGSFSAWGYLYAHDIPSVNFPSGLFEKVIIETAQAKQSGGNIVSSINSTGADFKTKASQITCIRGAGQSGTANFYAYRYAIGTWK